MRPLTSRLWPKLAALCVAVAAVPILAGGVWIAAGVETHTRALAEAYVDRTAWLAAESAHRYARGAASKLEGLSRLMRDRAGLTGSSDEEVRRQLMSWLETQVDPPGLFLSLEYRGEEPGRGFAVQQRALPDPPPLHAAGPTAPIGRLVEERYDQRTVALSAPVTLPRRDEPSGVLLGYLDLGELAAQLRAIAAGSERVDIELVDAEGGRMIVAGSPPSTAVEHVVRLPVGDLGWHVEVRSSLESARVTADAARRQAVGVTIVAAACAAALALLVAFWLVRPIRRLERAATELARGDLSARASLRRSDEIGDLGAAFDRMAGAVERLDRAKSDFVGTVSHELRTPLTALTANVQNLADGIHGPLAATQREAIERLADELARLRAIVDETLQLSRLEAGAETMRADPCDLRAVAEASRAERASVAAARGVTIEIVGSGSARADSRLLARALGNLLDNAITFAPAGTAVTIELAPGRLTVRDRGPGFALEDPFAPFSQGSTDGRKNPGVGLGLAIVARIAELHGGEVAASNDGGAVVTIRLPADEPA